MRISKCRNLVGLYATTVLLVTLGGIGLAAACLLYANSAQGMTAADGHTCIIYQSFPSLVDCTVSVRSSSVLSV